MNQKYNQNNNTNAVAFLIDDLDAIQTYKDTSFDIMLCCQNRNKPVFFFTIADMSLQNGVPIAAVTQLHLEDNTENWYQALKTKTMQLQDFSIIFIRKEPPFDANYAYATQMLDLVAAPTFIANNPNSIRSFNEKILALHFPEFTPKTLISKNMEKLKEFIEALTTAVIKPLDGMGGKSIFKISSKDPNTNVILETVTKNSQEFVICQEYLPEIKQGDKRVLIVAGEVIPFCLNRIPSSNDHRGNLAAGAKGVVQKLTDEEMKIAKAIAKVVIKQGLILVGLDFIGNKITEINITSPTCVREISRKTKIDISSKLLDYIEAKIKH